MLSLLGHDDPVTVFLVGQVPDHPTDAVHRHEPADAILLRNAFQAADELAAGKAQLADE